MKMTKDLVVPVVIASVIFAGAGFFGGMQYQKMQRGGFAAGQFGGRGGNGQRMMGGPGGPNGQNNFSRPVNGEIISSDDKSITVKSSDGSSKIILINDQSKISEATDSTKSALTTGKNVVVFGTTNQDGSVTAQNIQLNPQGMMFGQRNPGQNR